jgi:hypothetical protein
MVMQKRNKDWRKLASTLAKKIARMKAGYKCAYCGQGEPQRNTHGSHIYAEGKTPNMSADVDNILCLCATHHIAARQFKSSNWNWHGSPREAQDWFQEKYPELYKTLLKRSQDTMRTVNFEKKYKELKEEYAKLQ